MKKGENKEEKELARVYIEYNKQTIKMKFPIDTKILYL